jgi:RND family efflux transporter MFP subunit
MSAKPASSRLALKFFIVLLVLAVGGFVVRFTLRPIARTEAAYKGIALNAVPGSVTVQAEYIMELKSEAEGRLLTSELDPGKSVKLGQVLAQVDPADLQIEIEHLESEFEAAKKRLAIGSSITIELQNARDTLANSERLLNLKSFAEAEVIKQRRAIRVIEQRAALEEVNNQQLIEGLENTLKVRKNQLRKMTVTAPFDGVVSAVVARPGDLLAAKAPMATLITTSRTVEAKISEENFAGIKIGQKATVRFLGYGGTNYDASVIKILPTADPETQRYIVHLEVKIDPDKLVPGITGEVSIIVAERQNATLVARRALFDNRLYVVVDGKVQMRRVEVGYVALNVAEITKGIEVGDQVIVEELDKFRDGDSVQNVPLK